MRLKLTAIHTNLISTLWLLFTLVGLFGCQSSDRLTGVAAGAAGRYIVTAYIVSNDTLYSVRKGSAGYMPGINKIGVDNFTIALDVTGADQLTMRTDYWRNGLRSTESKAVVVKLTNSDYQFSLLKTNASSDYEGRVGRFTGFFYERSEGGLLIPLTTSSGNHNPSTSQEVVIVAQSAK
ncbi:hypothetical protein [Spirosoma pulveris]